MKQFRIIDIEDNKGGTDGHIIIVKANPIEDAPGSEQLYNMFGRHYYSYVAHEYSETELFIFPFNTERISKLIHQAKLADSDEVFWSPNMNDYYDASMRQTNGEIKTVHKHKSLKENKPLSDNYKNLFLIVAIHSRIDLDYGQIICVHAIPFTKLSSNGLGNISFKGEDMQYFYLHSDNNISQSMNQKAQQNLLWKVNLDDYIIKNDYVLDIFQKKNYMHDIYIHNSLIGKSFGDILDFDTISADIRFQNAIEEKVNSFIEDNDDLIDIQFDDLSDIDNTENCVAEIPV